MWRLAVKFLWQQLRCLIWIEQSNLQRSRSGVRGLYIVFTEQPGWRMDRDSVWSLFFFSLSLSFPVSCQDDKDLVHEFVVAEGLTCLIKVGAEADQNYQNYILRGKWRRAWGGPTPAARRVWGHLQELRYWELFERSGYGVRRWRHPVAKEDPFRFYRFLVTNQWLSSLYWLYL